MLGQDDSTIKLAAAKIYGKKDDVIEILPRSMFWRLTVKCFIIKKLTCQIILVAINLEAVHENRISDLVIIFQTPCNGVDNLKNGSHTLKRQLVYRNICIIFHFINIKAIERGIWGKHFALLRVWAVKTAFPHTTFS